MITGILFFPLNNNLNKSVSLIIQGLGFKRQKVFL